MVGLWLVFDLSLVGFWLELGRFVGCFVGWSLVGFWLVFGSSLVCLWLSLVCVCLIFGLCLVCVWLVSGLFVVAFCVVWD